jgi:cell division protein FtsL
MRLAICLALTTTILLSAIGTVLARHQSRKQFVELQALERQRDAMNDEWRRLLLQQATSGDHELVEKLARHKLGMTVPSSDAVILVAP